MFEFWVSITILFCFVPFFSCVRNTRTFWPLRSWVWIVYFCLNRGAWYCKQPEPRRVLRSAEKLKIHQNCSRVAWMFWGCFNEVLPKQRFLWFDLNLIKK